jgi:hypothetical protein
MAKKKAIKKKIPGKGVKKTVKKASPEKGVGIAQILETIDNEIANLSKARALLGVSLQSGRMEGRGRSPVSVAGIARSGQAAPKPRRVISAEGRKLKAFGPGPGH